jgi:hypothetical protein
VALLSAYPDEDSLARMVQYKLSKNLQAITTGKNLSHILFRLIQTAQAEGWLHLLITAAREANPGNPDLVSVSQELGLSPQIPRELALENIIRQQHSFLNVSTWRQMLGKLEYQVCRIEIKLSTSTKTYGTGFLVGPDLLLTNYHVMEPVIQQENLCKTGKPWSHPEDVVFRFDYKVLPESSIVNPGTVCLLKEDDWLVDFSPVSQWDSEPPPKSADPSLEELDYALVRLKDSPGIHSIGRDSEIDAPKRGWVKIREDFDFSSDSALIILQHPKAAPLKLSIDTNASINVNGNGTRITYMTNTEPGSSGSPCFNINWELIAIHHAGDPDSFSPTYNQGVTIKAILALLDQRGKKKLLQA